MSNKINSVIYTGVTNDLERRVFEHKNNLTEGFTKKYKCHKLVYYEEFKYVNDAIKREKQIKGGSRKQKEELVLNINPSWSDFSKEWESHKLE